ncbi:TrkH family potassium uptake protein [Candidatus Epulonipiscium viviparus]|uniref:TrkH family potassium uptake protein n=1 Tax=Candidatus Epulonipiscium viviparus TaxID=420336 RepID=UPI00016C061B|nr:TrkH family potassium uptake protein [Candidatus Epulopiscium viviparus]
MELDTLNNFAEKDPGGGRIKFGPAQILIFGFLGLIAAGTALLMLPISTTSRVVTPWLTALFTSTSAVCVTGLVVENTLAYWSLFGKIVIILCIQIGGLGFMTLVSMIFVVTGKKISFKNRLLMQEALSFNTTSGVVKFTLLIVKLTLLIEGIGALCLSFVFVPEYGFVTGIWYSIFHSISAFCNAGFDLVGNNSLMPYVQNEWFSYSIMILIILGGLGYTVWLDTYNVLKTKSELAEHFTWRQTFYKLSLHTKLVWIITIVLILGGFIFFFIAEYNNPATLGSLSFADKITAAMFQSVSPRTAGFNTLALDELTLGSKLMTVMLMFVGGSPAGTAGGIKTVTLGVLVLCAVSVLKGDSSVVVFKKKISTDQILKSLTIMTIAILIVMIALTILTFSEDATFIELLFETVSAFATVGLTLGITSSLSFTGKLVIIALMFIGRVGLITVGVALIVRAAKNPVGLQYPEEKVLVG